MVKKFVSWILKLEPYLLAVAVATLWTTQTQPWVPLALFIPIFLARLIVHRRLWTPTRLDILLVVFMGLALLNPRIAPFTRNWLWQLAFPLTGLLLIIGFTEHARTRNSTERLVMASLMLGLLVGVLGLGSAQWTEKSELFKPITAVLPTLRNFPGAVKGFNVNEIGGAMAWLMPFAGGIAIYDWREGNKTPRRFYATLVFFLLWAALFLGQSRLAIFGVAVAMGLLIFALIPHNRWRYLSLTVLIAFTTFQVLLMAGVFYTDDSLLERDEGSFEGRLDIWAAALDAVYDYPLTGVGINMFRADYVRDRYPVPGYEDRVLPHTHNEFLQIATDMGIPGLILFVSWHLVLLSMFVRTWRQGDSFAKAVSASSVAALIAHGVFGLADAITLWDRFAFVFWWFVAMTVAQYKLTVRVTEPVTVTTSQAVELKQKPA